MRNAVAALALLTLAACDPDEGLRTQPPATDPGIDVRVPRIRTATMQSGMPVYLAKGSSVRIAAVGLLLRAGPHYDPPGKEGLARLTAELIESGTARNGVPHREHFEALGTDLHVGVSPESILLAVEVFSDETPLALRTLAGLMRDPSIAVDELENARRERSNNIARMIESPDALASLAMAEVVLRERNLHSAWGLGTEASVGRITADDVIAHLGRAADPGRAAVIIVGDVGEKEANEWVRVAFGDWRGSVAAGPSALSEPPPPVEREAIVFVPVPADSGVFSAVASRRAQEATTTATTVHESTARSARRADIKSITIQSLLG